jgi:hypothetical protein
VPSDGPAQYQVQVAFDTGPLAGKLTGTGSLNVSSK